MSHVLEAILPNGRPNRVVDYTDEVPHNELKALLDDLTQEKKFGLTGLSSPGSDPYRRTSGRAYPAGRETVSFDTPPL